MKSILIVFVTFIVIVQDTPLPESVDIKQEKVSHLEEISGYVEGDMILSPDLNERAAGSRPKNQRWINGIIPYQIDSSISDTHATLIVNTMKKMENLTKIGNTQCITFRSKQSNDSTFIRIANGTGCSAPVGYWPNYIGNRTVTLMHSTKGTCMTSGIIQHELTHVLGFYHEQSRPDRDIYVSIQWDNIQIDNYKDFTKYNISYIDILNTSYDYASIMHYGWNSFAIDDDLPTIIPIENKTAFIGQRIQLSINDILGIQRYYNCSSMISNVTTNNSLLPIDTTNNNNSNIQIQFKSIFILNLIFFIINKFY